MKNESPKVLALFPNFVPEKKATVALDFCKPVKPSNCFLLNSSLNLVSASMV
jgi:hypothetical protein